MPLTPRADESYYLLTLGVVAPGARVRKKQQERRQDIVEAVVALAAGQEGKDVTTQAIADRLGIAQPTVFRHFPSRDAIYQATIGWIAEGLSRLLDQAFASDQPSDERLRLLLQRQLEFISRHRGIPRILFSDRLHAESSRLRAQILAVIEAYERRIQTLLTAGMESGRFRPDLDPQETSRLIVVMVQGLTMRWSLGNFSFPLEKQGEALWRFLWPSLAARPNRTGR